MGGTAQHADDPGELPIIETNPDNDVITIRTSDPGSFGTVSRKLNVKITALDNHLEFKSYFTLSLCGDEPPPEEEFAPRGVSLGNSLLLPNLPPVPSPLGLSPRIQLAIDLNADGKPDGSAFGHLLPTEGCIPRRWNYHDVTDLGPRWDITQLALEDLCGTLPLLEEICGDIEAGTGLPWDSFELALTLLFPNHRVCSGVLVDDSQGVELVTGTAYYDLISLGRATWHIEANTAGRGFAKGCGEGDHGDDNHHGDKDRDHDVDPHDLLYP